MPVLPDEISAGTIRRRWRGYDRDQIDEFLSRVGTDYGGAIDRIAAVSEESTRVRSERDQLSAELTARAEGLRRELEQIRADADADAATVRKRAEQAAALITSQAEAAAALCLRQAEAMRATAQADADAARQRLEDADRRAHQLEDAARNRWDGLRLETDARFEQLQVAERRFAGRVRQLEAALNSLRSQVTLFDQVQRFESVLSELRSDALPVRAPEAEERPDDLGGNEQKRCTPVG